MRKSFVKGLMALGAIALIYGCTLSDARKEAAVKGVVEDGCGQKVANATIWLIPAADVATMAKTPIEIKKGSAARLGAAGAAASPRPITRATCN